MKYSRYLLFFMASLSLTGCFNGDIKIVKESRIQGHPDFNIGQAFDNRHTCKSTDWKTFKDDRQRSIVEYSCEYKFALDFYKSATDTFAKSSKERYEKSLASNDVAMKELNENIKQFKNKIESIDSADSEYLKATKDVDYINPIGNKATIVLTADEKNDLRNTYLRNYKKKIEDDELELKKRVTGEYYAGETENIELMKKNQEKLENYKSVKEIIQWSINDSAPTILGSKLILELKGGSFEYETRLQNIMDDIYRNDKVFRQDGAQEENLRELWKIKN